MAPHERLSVVLAIVLTSTSTVVVALRFYTRYFLVRKVTASDWTMLLALVATWASAVVNLYMIKFLDYRHVKPGDSKALEKVVVGSLLSLWLYRVIYIVDLCLIKTSILLFYNDIAASNRRFHFGSRTLLGTIIVGGVAMVIASVFMCYPVADAWSYKVFMAGLRGKHATQCYDPSPFWLFNASYNLVTDVIIWTLPTFFFLNLQIVPLRQRLELISIFSVGILAIVASAVRLYTMVIWLSSFKQQGLNTANVLLWSQVEQHAGLIAGSIPFLRPLFRKALGKVRNREQPSSMPSPEARLVGGWTPEAPPEMPRRLIIPSPRSTLDLDSQGFRQPEWALEPIQRAATESTWHSEIWDGTQVRKGPSK